MTQFLGTHKSRLDAKGRVSIPAPFRNALKAEGAKTAPLILRPSHKHPCVEGWPPEAFHALAKPMNALDVFSEDQDDLATALYADAWSLEADADGRIVLPRDLIEHAKLGETVEFMGIGGIFQIWEPEAAAQRRADARAKSRGLTLRGGMA